MTNFSTWLIENGTNEATIGGLLRDEHFKIVVERLPLTEESAIVDGDPIVELGSFDLEMRNFVEIVIFE